MRPWHFKDRRWHMVVVFGLLLYMLVILSL
jgi:hypothetical protein